jgi:hypothetical protein
MGGGGEMCRDIIKIATVLNAVHHMDGDRLYEDERGDSGEGLVTYTEHAVFPLERKFITKNEKKVMLIFR